MYGIRLVITETFYNPAVADHIHAAIVNSRPYITFSIFHQSKYIIVADVVLPGPCAIMCNMLTFIIDDVDTIAVTANPKPAFTIAQEGMNNLSYRKRFGCN